MRGAPCPGRLALSWLALFAGCVDEPSLVRTDPLETSDADEDILPLDGWEVDPVEASSDAALFGRTGPCSTATPSIEEGLVEFDTAVCSSYSVRAPLVAGLEEGDVVEVAASHSILQADSPSTGRMILRVDGDEVWSWERSIPGPAAATTISLRATRDLPAGTWVGLHVSNHGANNWRLVSMRVIDRTTR